MVFHWNLSNSKSPRASRILLSILADLNNTVVWMIFDRPPISNSSRPFPHLWGPFQARQLLLVSLWLSLSRAFFVHSHGPRIWLPVSFSHRRYLVAFLRESQSPQVVRTLLGIWADLNNAVSGIVSIRPLISNSSSPLSKALETGPSVLITIGITVTHMFHSFLCSLAVFRYFLVFCFLWFSHCHPLAQEDPIYGRFSCFC